MKRLLALIEKNRPLSLFIKHYNSAEMDLSSIAVAYYLLITTFPLLIIMANLFPYLNVDINSLLNFIQEYLPSQLYGGVRSVIINIFSEPSGSVLGFAILVTIWTTGRSLTSLQKAVNKAYGVSNHRDVVVGYFVGIVLSILVLFFITFAFFLSTFAQAALVYMNEHYELSKGIYNMLTYLAQPLMVTILLLGLGLMYWVLPNVRINRVRYILPGTLFTTFVLIFLSNVFAGYVNRQLDRMIDFKFFGSVILFVMMLWFTFLARILIIGAVLNATYQDYATNGHLHGRRGDILSIFESRKAKIKKLKKSKKDSNQ